MTNSESDCLAYCNDVNKSRPGSECNGRLTEDRLVDRISLHWRVVRAAGYQFRRDNPLPSSWPGK